MAKKLGRKAAESNHEAEGDGGGTAVADPPKKGRERQTMIPGTEPQKNARVERAAEAYEEARDEWMALSEPVKKAKQKLIDTMIEEKVESYKRGDLEVKVTHKDVYTVKVKRRSVDDDEEDFGDEV